ncbi:biotin--[acetyl-CoA-carboxylase] ligase [Microlunatus aurantiacus]|uniref:biotin--[acetyl-CoA-carboxylase] ligase n=1 Tax=Microlunatus aurantiacus TaxID=446786 RepID=UPI0031CF781D
MTYPDPLDGSRLSAVLTVGDPLWRSIEVVPATGSTNADLAARARRGESAGRVLVTDHQRAGRGRLGRTWTAPAGSSVAMSVLLRPERDPASWTWLPLLAGLAVADSLRAVADVPAVLKWPNDVLVDDAKVCGILAERVDGPAGPACVLGLGINVHLTADQLPVPTATSLALLRPDRRLARNDIIATVLATLALLYHRWQAGLDAELAAEYVARSGTLGRTVTVLGGDGARFTGEAIAVDPAGRLRVRTPSGVQTFAAGDVTHLR